MRRWAWCFVVVMFVATPVWAQEIPDRALPSVKAPAKLPKTLLKKKPKAAPTVVRSNTWWGKRSALSQKLLAAGGVSALAGVALVAAGSSMANNAIDRRHFLQQQDALDDKQRNEFTDQGGATTLGQNLHLAGWVLCGAGSLVAGVGGIL